MLPGFGQCQNPTEWTLYSLLANKLVPLAAANQPQMFRYFFFVSPLAGPFVKVGNGVTSNRQQVSVNVCVCLRQRERKQIPQAPLGRVCICITH